MNCAAAAAAPIGNKKKPRKTNRKKQRKSPKSRIGNNSKRQQKQNKRGKRKISFRHVTKTVKDTLKREKPKGLESAIKVALKSINKSKGRIRPARIIRVPKTGGILPLIPIFAGLSALGALSGGAAGIAKAVNDAKSANQQLKENQRHNQTMESIAMGKGLFLKPYKTGLGLFLPQRGCQRKIT